MADEQRFIARMHPHIACLIQAMAGVEFWQGRWQAQIDRAHERRQAAILRADEERRAASRDAFQEHRVAREADQRQARGVALATYRARQGEVQAKARALFEWAGLLAAPWEDPRWDAWAAPSEGYLPKFVRVGQLIEERRPDARASAATPPTHLQASEAASLPLRVRLAGLAFSPDGARIAIGRADAAIQVWEVRSGRAGPALLGHSDAVLAVAFTPDGKLLASASQDSTVRLWDVVTEREIYCLRGHEGWVFGVACAPNQRYLASAGQDHTVRLWPLAEGQSERVLRGHTDIVLGLACAPDSRTIASASEDGTIRLWQEASDDSPRVLQGHDGPVQSVTFSPDGRILASGGYDGTVRLWNCATGALERTMEAHPHPVLAVAIAPDGGHLASASGDGTVVLWDLASAQPVQRWDAHRDLCSAVAFSPSGQALGSVSFDGVARLWALAPRRAGTGTETLTLPALAPLRGGRNLLFKARGDHRARAVDAVQSVMLRLLAAVPPGALRFTLIDPVGHGENVGAFMYLKKTDPELVNHRAWTEDRDIQAKLQELTAHIDTVQQDYLQGQYGSIDEYNAVAGEVREPYRILVVLNYPTKFSADAAERLASIAGSGARCGIYTIVLADDEQLSGDRRNQFHLPELERHSTVFVGDGDRFWWDDDVLQHCRLELDSPPDQRLKPRLTDTVFGRILAGVEQGARAGSRVEVPFDKLFAIWAGQRADHPDQYPGLPERVAAHDPRTWWQGDTTPGLIGLLGRVGAKEVQCLSLGTGTAQHVVVAGQTGSGKSTLLHTLITNLAILYPDDELEMYLVDFKKGVEFQTYARNELPHARVIAIESEREFGLSVLQGLAREFDRRGDLFRKVGTQDLAKYRQLNGERLPRILLLVDEFQEFFTEDDSIAQEARALLDRLVRQGRSTGIHIVLASQTLAGSYTLPRPTLDQIGVRVALQCSENDSRLILADDNPAARSLSRPGQAIYNAGLGRKESNSFFQVAYLDNAARDGYLSRLRELALADRRPRRPQIVFEGNELANVANNTALQALLATPDWPAPARAVPVWLGDPVTIADPVAVRFRRQSASSLLVVGQDEAAALGMLAMALIALAAHHPVAPQGHSDAPAGPFYVLDFSAVDSAHADFFDALLEALPHRPRRGRSRQLGSTLDALAGEVERRRAEADADDVTSSAATLFPSLYLLLFAAHRARDLRADDDLGGFVPLGSYTDNYSAEPPKPSPSQQLATILREGPELGVHTLVWCDTMPNLHRVFSRPNLREFAMRVGFQMSAEDSSSLLDTAAAARLGAHRAIYASEEEGRLEKFRPYGLPSSDWLSAVAAQLRAKPMPMPLGIDHQRG